MAPYRVPRERTLIKILLAIPGRIHRYSESKMVSPHCLWQAALVVNTIYWASTPRHWSRSVLERLRQLNSSWKFHGNQVKEIYVPIWVPWAGLYIAIINYFYYCCYLIIKLDFFLKKWANKHSALAKGLSNLLGPQHIIGMQIQRSSSHWGMS